VNRFEGQRGELTTNPDHNGNRDEPILMGTMGLRTQVSDVGPHPGRVLQTKD
jgi:hypothetical protein